MPSWSKELSQSQSQPPPRPLSAAPPTAPPSSASPPGEAPAATVTWHERLQVWCADDSDWNTRAGVAGVVFLVAATILAVVRPPFVLDCDGHRSWKRILTISAVWALLVLALPSALAYWGS